MKQLLHVLFLSLLFSSTTSRPMENELSIYEKITLGIVCFALAASTPYLLKKGYDYFFERFFSKFKKEDNSVKRLFEKVEALADTKKSTI